MCAKIGEKIKGRCLTNVLTWCHFVSMETFMGVFKYQCTVHCFYYF